MLKEIYIKNMAVIDELRLSFDFGFQVLTGETGAGKSILVEAMGLILGEKAKPSLVRAEETQALVEAVFNVKDQPTLVLGLSEMGFGDALTDDELVIKRQIHRDGQNKIFINGQRASLSELQNLSARLIDYTGQHDSLTLLKSKNDTDILDAFLPHLKNLEEYKIHYQKAFELHKEILQKTKMQFEKEERLQWIDFQLKEFSHISIGSSKELEALYVAKHLAKNKASLDGFYAVADQSVMEALNLMKGLEKKLEKEPTLTEVFGFAETRLTDLKCRIEDFSYELSLALQKIQVADNVGDINQIESQLFWIEKLKRKFSVDFEGLFLKKNELESQKSELEALDVDLKNLNSKLSKQLVQLASLAKVLYEERKSTAEKVSAKVQNNLKYLQMDKAKFEIRVELAQDLEKFESYKPEGAQSISFWLSPNPGLGFKLLSQIASGGETARLFLAIKSVLSEFKPTPTFVFDEIDTGISGSTVELTGLKLKELSKKSQVFCITHHAQIASLADTHFYVQKEIQNEKTMTRVNRLSVDNRVNEIARLMGGVKITDKNRAFAKELLQGARQNKTG